MLLLILAHFLYTVLDSTLVVYINSSVSLYNFKTSQNCVNFIQNYFLKIKIGYQDLLKLSQLDYYYSHNHNNVLDPVVLSLREAEIAQLTGTKFRLTQYLKQI